MFMNKNWSNQLKYVSNPMLLCFQFLEIFNRLANWLANFSYYIK
jgi:hypothetical protein